MTFGGAVIVGFGVEYLGQYAGVTMVYAIEILVQHGDDVGVSGVHFCLSCLTGRLSATLFFSTARFAVFDAIA